MVLVGEMGLVPVLKLLRVIAMIAKELRDVYLVDELLTSCNWGSVSMNRCKRAIKLTSI